MMISITISLPIPHRFLSPNSRVCWQAKSREVKQYRTAAKYLALEACKSKAPGWKHATAKAVFFFKINRNRDRDNALGSLKAAFDGLADAGIVGNDSGITHLPVGFEIDKLYPRVEITIEKGKK